MDGKVDTLQGGRDEMRGLGARIVSPFLRGFSPALLWFLCLLGWCCLFGFGFVLLSKPVERLLQVIPGSPLFCFRIPRELTDHAPCSLGNAGKKWPFVHVFASFNDEPMTR